MISAIILVQDDVSGQLHLIARSSIGNTPVLQYMVNALHSARVLEIAIVLPDHTQEVQSSLSWFGGKLLINQKNTNTTHSSVLMGMDALDCEDLLGVLICPLSVPFLSQSLIVDILQGFWRSKKNIIVPAYHGKQGNPIIIGKPFFKEFATTSSMEFFMQQHAADIHYVETEEEDSIISIATLSDLVSKRIPTIP